MTTVLHIRNVSDEAAARFRRGARVRGLLLGEYLERLSRLPQGVANMRRSGYTPEALLYDLGLTLPTED